jgi:hypothetical protein
MRTHNIYTGELTEPTHSARFLVSAGYVGVKFLSSTSLPLSIPTLLVVLLHSFELSLLLATSDPELLALAVKAADYRGNLNLVSSAFLVAVGGGKILQSVLGIGMDKRQVKHDKSK